MKKYILLLVSLAAICLMLAACELEDVVGGETAGTEHERESTIETEIHDESSWIPPDTDGTRPPESESEDETDDSMAIPVVPDEWGDVGAHIFNLVDSYAQDNFLFLRAEHLSVSEPNVTYPAVLRISDLTAWKNFYDGQSLDLWNEEFFSTHSLLVLITEGRSGSIRYRVDDVSATEGELNVELTAMVPDALTMDIVHWCVVIPVTKAEADLPVDLTTQDEPVTNEGEVTITTPEPRLIHFGYWSDQSYVQDGILYGRLDDDVEGASPVAEIVTSFADWQARHTVSETAASGMDEAFLAGLEALDEEFFAEKSLLILFKSEGSGSNRHRVDGVAAKDGILTVTVTTLYPEIGTCDMAYWALIIPIDKDMADLPVHVETSTEREG